MIKTTDEFAPADRYLYDFRVCSTDKGFAQLDSYQDASYFGTWINPEKRLVFTYCEGDTTLNECETDEELRQVVEKIEAWNAENGSRRFSNGFAIGIDPGWNHDSALAESIRKAGLGKYLH